jgi:nucleoside-diphosphate-sugar epimerase
MRVGVAPLEVDLSECRLGASLPDRADAIIHLAQSRGRYPRDASDLFAVNTESTGRLLSYAAQAGVRCFILASTGSVYRRSDDPLTEDASLAADDAYAVSKRAAELLVLASAVTLRPVVLRLFVPYGPGQNDRLIPGLIHKVRTGTPIEIVEGGVPRTNPIWIDDLVTILVQALEGEADGVVNVAGPRVVSIAELARLAGMALGMEPKFVAKRGNRGDLVASTARMQALFGPPQLVEPAEGIRQMIGR